MSWVAEIVEAVGGQPRGQDSHREVDWLAVEQVIGSRLPSDYKEIWGVFGEGRFSGYLDLFPPLAGHGESISSVLHSMRRAQEEIAQARAANAPYDIHTRGGNGLLPWGGSVQGDDFCWLVGAGDPDSWPVVAREHVEEWENYHMSMSEFLYRVLVDVTFEDFTVADLVPSPYFVPIY